MSNNPADNLFLNEVQYSERHFPAQCKIKSDSFKTKNWFHQLGGHNWLSPWL
jgi:hypothetical protein